MKSAVQIDVKIFIASCERDKKFNREKFSIPKGISDDVNNNFSLDGKWKSNKIEGK